ncbi:hypothetical protein [Tenacibaculum piscium]|uniref:hypothetical protein n=1 Tax=Tenacibaculum piscium TaxID=1458515 RepID=UPI001F3993C9|nr:hypothetical protein [Tenacibaculum piscium]
MTVEAESIVEMFNENFPVGSVVRQRNVGVKTFPFKNRIVKTKAFLSQNGEPVVFFTGVSGYYSILPDFIDYTKVGI